MSITHRVKRLLAASAAGAMVLALMPSGIAAADVIEFDDIDACADAPEVDFDDVPDTAFWADQINCMAAYGITIGVDANNYDRSGTVTRGQMASFIARTVLQAEDGTTDIPASTDDAFDDIAGTAHADAINFIADLGITLGVDGDSYEPGGNVTRGQMASFIARALDSIGVDIDVEGDGFPDIAGNTHESNILALQALGVVEGQTDGNFNPGAAITREQMSGFIVRGIAVIDAAGLWNGVFTVEAEVTEAVIVANITDTEGNAYTVVQGGEIVIIPIGTDPVRQINGAPVSAGLFAASLVPGNLVEYDESSNTHNIIPRTTEELLASGLLVGGDLHVTNADTNLIEPVSGVEFVGTGDFPDWDAAAATYMVDGSTTTQAVFALNVSHGDTLTVTGEGDADDPFVFALENGSITGSAANDTAATLELDAGWLGTLTAGNDLAGTATFDATGVTAAYAYTVDGDAATATEFANNLSVGDTVTYSRAAGVETFALTNVAPPEVSGQLVDASPALHGAVVTAVEFLPFGGTVGTDEVTVTFATDVDIITLDGVLVEGADLEDELNVGMIVSYQEEDEDTGTVGRVEITSAPLSGVVDHTSVDTTTKLLDIFAADSDSEILYSFTNYTVANEVYAAGTSITYSVNGSSPATTTVGDFEAALDNLGPLLQGEFTATLDGTTVRYSLITSTP